MKNAYHILKTLYPKLVLCILAFALSNFLLAQQTIETNLSHHVYFLADDNLQGRSPGTNGELQALNYIEQHFIEYGLTPLPYQNSFRQNFEFKLGKILSGNNALTINNKVIRLNKDFFPLNLSANGKVEGQVVFVGYGILHPSKHDDYKNKTDLNGKVFLMELSSPDGIHPHSAYTEYSDIKTKVKLAEKKGAKAVVFINTDTHLKNPTGNLKHNVKEVNIPVVFLNQPNLINNGDLVSLSVSLADHKKTGTNILGYIDNHAENTVIIGAHYDHLGYGKDGGSRYLEGFEIHNGADDNASGIATMLELAKRLKTSFYTNNNYLFIAFSAEELGLIGSKYLVEHIQFDLNKVNYMFNLDMVGTYRQDKGIGLNGVGTSPIFKNLVSFLKEKSHLNIKTTESGVGPSDHTSFYLQDIPVIHFFTGTTEHYHKPSDDPYRINYKGIDHICGLVFEAIAYLDNRSKLEFTKTKDSDSRKTPKFSVTLGVIPDYMFDKVGMRIDGVSPDKPADKAGLQKGDVVLKMGSYAVEDMMGYMKALSKFKKGETTEVVIKRGDKTLTKQVTF